MLPLDPPASSGIRGDELASGTGDGGLILDVTAELARRATALLGYRGLAELAIAAGVPMRDLAATRSRGGMVAPVPWQCCTVAGNPTPTSWPRAAPR